MYRVYFTKDHIDAELPTQGLDDVGFDLKSVEKGKIAPRSSAVISTGLKLAKKVESDPVSLRTIHEADRGDKNTSPYVLSLDMKRLCVPYFKIEGRSGLASKNIFPIGGIIDPSYRGVIKVVLYNGGEAEYEYKVGDKIAQFVCYLVVANSPEVRVSLHEVESTSVEKTKRGAKGFGSSGR